MEKTLRIHDGYDSTSPYYRNFVRNLQLALIAQGFSELRPDGLFGNETDEAVRKFQTRIGLRVDGIVGPNTWAALATGKAPDEKLFPSKYSLNHPALTGHYDESKRYRLSIEQGSAKASGPADFTTSVILGIGSRESGWGLLLRPRGPEGKGDHGHGRGLMQIDDRWHPEFISSGKWKDARENILYAAGILSNYAHHLQARFHLESAGLLRATLAAYNCGLGRVGTAIKDGLDIDYFTTSRDYSKDILERAGWFQRKEQSLTDVLA